MDGTILLVARSDVLVATVVQCLVKDERRGGHRLKD